MTTQPTFLPLRCSPAAGVARVLLAATAALAVLVVPARAGAEPSAHAPVCDDQAIRDVFNIIRQACTTEGCDPTKLGVINNINKQAFLLALKKLPRDGGRVEYVFFPQGEERLDHALNFKTRIEDRLDGFKREVASNGGNTWVYVIGRASATGTEVFNQELSQARVNSVYESLLSKTKDGKPGLDCGFVQKGAFGKTVMQLDKTDANNLGLPHDEYNPGGRVENHHKADKDREDVLMLNQSVMVIAYPCRNEVQPPPKPATGRQ